MKRVVVLATAKDDRFACPYTRCPSSRLFSSSQPWHRAVSPACSAPARPGGGVFLVPFLVLVVGMPFQAAAAISLTTVIATSSAVSRSRRDGGMINLRLGMLLEVATASGGLLGGITAQMLPPATLRVLFAGSPCSPVPSLWRGCATRT